MKKTCLLAFASLFVLFSLRCSATTISENFTSNPQQGGWQVFGNTNLFQWNAANQNLEVTWDSSQPNSCFYRPLGTVLSRTNDFSVSFDLRLNDFVAGNDPKMPSPFPLCVGFINTTKAAQSNFFRGTGYNSPDMVEFSFFPDPGGNWQWGPSITATAVDSTGFNWAYGFDPNGLATNDVYHVTLTYTGSASNLVMTITRNGNAFVTNAVATLSTNFTDFAVDAISINSWSQEGQDTNNYGGVIYAGSILAHGTVDNFAATLPSPISSGTTITENFSFNPQGGGWQVLGNTNLFQWDSANQNLEVTWDSAQPNSYFYRPLGTILSKTDDFSVAFDLRLSDFTAGIDPAMPSPFPLCIGFINVAKASQGNFYRGTGYNSPDIVEFSFFPDPGGTWQWGPSITANMVDSTGFNWNSGGFEPQGLTSNDLYHVMMTYTASSSNLVMTITRNGTDFVTNCVARLGSTFTDFRVDAISVSSYSQEGQDTNNYGGVIYAGSLLAHGTVDNFSATLPPPPIQNLSGGFINSVWQVQFLSRTNWNYVLERSANLSQWDETSVIANGTGAQLSLTDTNSAASTFYFYRVKANRP